MQKVCILCELLLLILSFALCYPMYTRFGEDWLWIMNASNLLLIVYIFHGTIGYLTLKKELK